MLETNYLLSKEKLLIDQFNKNKIKDRKMTKNRKSIESFNPEQIDTAKVKGGSNVLLQNKTVDETEHNVKTVGRFQPRERLSERSSE